MRFPRSLTWVLLLPVLLTSAGLLTSSAAAQEGEPPGRRVVTKVADEGYLWKLLAWKDGEEACQLLVGHPGLPTWEEVSLACGYETFEEWRETPPCHGAAAGGDTSKCKGLYLLFAGYLEGERTVVEELPEASVTIMLEGCCVWDRSQICLQDPVLVLLGHEPLPDEHIVAIHAEVDREPHECAGNVCRIPLELYPGRELEIVFWVESSYGDETQRYEAWARAEAVPWPDGPVDAYWQVDVLSTQWTGPQTASSAEDADHAHGCAPSGLRSGRSENWFARPYRMAMACSMVTARVSSRAWPSFIPSPIISTPCTMTPASSIGLPDW